METFSSKKLPSSYNKQEQYSSSINSTKTKIKLLSHYPDKHYQTSLNLQQSLFKTHKSKIEEMNMTDIRIKILKDYLLKNNQIDRHVILMILQPPQSYNQEQSYEKVLLRQLSHKVKILIEQNKRLHKQSEQKIQTTQIMLIIQKINQNNINKMKQQQQMINNLQLKLNAVDEIRQYLKQLQFEKIVKLQQSNISNKIEITKCPPSTGQIAFTNQIFHLNVQKHIQHLNTSDQTPVQGALHQQQRQLHKKNQELREQLQLLRQKLDNELQAKFNLLGQKEQLQMNLQKLKEQRKQYQFMLNEAKEQLKHLFTKQQEPNIYLNLQQNKQKIKNNEYQTIPVISQLKDIKNMLIKCNKNNIHSLQVQLLQLIQERNQYRREYLKLKNKIMYNESKNQVKFLMDKNIQLQQKCCFYEKQIDRYEVKLREMMEERQNNTVDNIIKDFEDMNKGDKDDLGLKYSRATHTCIINTINRLEQLEKTLMKSQTN